MKLEYKINEEDFLDFQLFTVSQSERINKKKKRDWILLTTGSFIFSFYFYLNSNIVMTIYFGFVGIIIGLFYSKYYRWRLKKHYKIHIRENYAKRFGETEIIEIGDEIICSKDKTGESKINISEIEKVNETDKHFFLKISTGLSLIIPKLEINNVDELRIKLQSIGLNIDKSTINTWK